MSERTPQGASRRAFLGGGAAAVGGVVVAACSSGKKSTGATTETTAGSTGPLSGDLQIAATAASIENLAAFAYQAVIDAGAANKLGSLPAVVSTFLETVRRQHGAHAEAWNAVLTSAGRTRVTELDAAYRPEIDQALPRVKDAAGALNLLLGIENVIAATMLAAIGSLRNTSALKAAASMQPVTMQHAAVASYLLGRYPVPDTFAQANTARPFTDYRQPGT